MSSETVGICFKIGKKTNFLSRFGTLKIFCSSERPSNGCIRLVYAYCTQFFRSIVQIQERSTKRLYVGEIPIYRLWGYACKKAKDTTWRTINRMIIATKVMRIEVLNVAVESLKEGGEFNHRGKESPAFIIPTTIGFRFSHKIP